MSQYINGNGKLSLVHAQTMVAFQQNPFLQLPGLLDPCLEGEGGPVLFSQCCFAGPFPISRTRREMRKWSSEQWPFLQGAVN